MDELAKAFGSLAIEENKEHCAYVLMHSNHPVAKTLIEVASTGIKRAFADDLQTIVRAPDSFWSRHKIPRWAKALIVNEMELELQRRS